MAVKKGRTGVQRAEDLCFHAQQTEKPDRYKEVSLAYRKPLQQQDSQGQNSGSGAVRGEGSRPPGWGRARGPGWGCLAQVDSLSRQTEKQELVTRSRNCSIQNQRPAWPGPQGEGRSRGLSRQCQCSARDMCCLPCGQGPRRPASGGQRDFAGAPVVLEETEERAQDIAGAAAQAITQALGLRLWRLHPQNRSVLGFLFVCF